MKDAAAPQELHLTIQIYPDPELQDRTLTLGHPDCPWSISPVDPATISAAAAANAVVDPIKYHAELWGNRLESMLRQGLRILSDANGAAAAKPRSKAKAAAQPGYQLHQLPRLYSDPAFRRLVASQTPKPESWKNWLEEAEMGQKQDRPGRYQAILERYLSTQPRTASPKTPPSRALAHPSNLPGPETAELDLQLQLSPTANLIAAFCLIEHYPAHQAWIRFPAEEIRKRDRETIAEWANANEKTVNIIPM